MKTPRYADLTPDQLAALHRFSVKHGKGWKDELAMAWMTGSAGHELHSLRNSHGPTWLSRFTFPL